MKNNINIASLISGGVDSSVAIHLLVEQGFKPHLFYIKIGMDEKDDSFTCTMEEDLEMATSIAYRYGLKLDVIDLHKEYWDGVVQYILNKVKNGETPNGDVMCNRLIKFGAFNDKIGKDFDKIMTGHYATTIEEDGLTWLGTSVDAIKDQTDFLAQIEPWQLNKALFPIGNLSKNEVRKIAEENKLITAKRKDSQGICFLGNINYNDFIKKYLGIRKGDIVEFETNKKLGEHNGYWFHTIGQRRGIGISGGPYYVVKKDIENNIVYVTRNHELFNRTVTEINITKPHWVTVNPFPYLKDIPQEITFKIRHSFEFHKGIISLEDNKFIIKSNEQEIGGIASGQFCTIYDKEHRICYGSSEIIY